MKLLIVALLFATCGLTWHEGDGQTTLPSTPAIPASPGGVIPAPDGKTIVSTNNVWSCVASGLPSGIGWDGSTFSVPNLSAQTLTLTEGTAYPDGQYLANFKSGTLTFTPYVPSIGGGSSIPVSCTVQMPAQTVQGLQAAQATATCTGIDPARNAPSLPQPAILPPKVNGQTVWLMDAVISAVNQITVRAWLMYLNPPQTFPATTFIVKVQ